MPIVPNQPSLISNDVSAPGSPIDSFGKPFDAAAQTGALVSSLGIGLATKIKEDEAQNEATNHSFEQKIKADHYYEELKQYGQDGKAYQKVTVVGPDGMPMDTLQPIMSGDRHLTMSEHYDEWLRGQYQSSLEAMPNPRAKEIYRDQMNRYTADKISQSFSDQLVAQNRASERSVDEWSQKAADAIESSPTTDRFYNYIHDVSEIIDKKVQSGIFPASVKQAKIDEKTSQAALAYFKGRANAILAMNPELRMPEIDKELARLAGTSVDSYEQQRRDQGLVTLDNALEPEKKEAMHRAFLELRHDQVKSHEKDIRLLVSAGVAQNKAGIYDQAQVNFNKANILAVQSGWKDKNPLEYGVLAAEARVSEYAGKHANSDFAFLPDQTRRQIIESDTAKGKAVGPYGDIGAPQAEEYKKTWNDKNDGFTAKAKENWGEFVANQASNVNGPITAKAVTKITSLVDPEHLENFQQLVPQLANANRLSKSLYDKGQRGTDEYYNLFDKKVSKAIGDKIHDPTVSASTAVNLLKGLSQVYGSDFPSELNRWINRGDLRQEDRWLITMPGLINNDKWVSAVRGYKDTEKLYSDITKGQDLNKDASIDRPKELLSYVKVMAKQSGFDNLQDNQLTSMMKVVDTLAAREVIEQRSSSLSKAYSEVMKTFINDNGKPYSNGQSQIWIPNKVSTGLLTPQDHAQIDFFVRGNSDPEAMKLLVKPVPTNPADLSDPKFEDKSYAQMSRDGYWTMAPNHDGLTFMFPLGGKVIRAIGKDGNPLVIPFHPMMRGSIYESRPGTERIRNAAKNVTRREMMSTVVNPPVRRE